MPAEIRFNNGYAIHAFQDLNGWSCRVFLESLVECKNTKDFSVLRYYREDAEGTGVYFSGAGLTKIDALLKGAHWIAQRLNPEWIDKHEIYRLIFNLKEIGVLIYEQEPLRDLSFSEDISGIEILQNLKEQGSIELSIEPGLFDKEIFKLVMDEFGLSEIGIQRFLNQLYST